MIECFIKETITKEVIVSIIFLMQEMLMLVMRMVHVILSYIHFHIKCKQVEKNSIVVYLADYFTMYGKVIDLGF